MSNQKKSSSIVLIILIILAFGFMIRKYIIGSEIKIYELEATTLQGEKLKANELKGKVVVLNFWATWCGPCVQEMPLFDQLYQTLDSNQVIFVLATDESQSKVNAFSNKHQLAIPLYRLDREFSEFNVRTIPVTWIFDRNGNLVKRKLGAYASADELHQSLLEYL